MFRGLGEDTTFDLPLRLEHISKKMRSKKKIEGGLFGDIKRYAKKVSQSRNNMQKKCCSRAKLEPTFLLGRSQKLLFNLYAKCQ